MTLFEILTVATSVLVLVTSITAIWFTIKQSKETVRHNKLSLRPFLNAHVDTTKENQVIVTVKNNGLGTALITKLLIYIDDKEVGGRNQVKQAVFNVVNPNIYNYILKDYGLIDDNGTALAKGDKFILLGYEIEKPHNHTLEDVKPYLRRLSMCIEYESLYEEKFTIPRSIEDWI
ncbi:hypothetical protein SPONN_2281 [uncultured Candidatus Thioglobus sp.]|nr:hypothetical protein SPONN_2281 [uncultured Candidatus Thioglobus sp.]SMN00114.1 hypothetical protein SPONL_1084 [uncultured Candidatus Thioglobus sp.]